MDEPQLEWDDADRILLALMRLSERVEQVEAKLRELLGEEDDGEEETDA